MRNGVKGANSSSEHNSTKAIVVGLSNESHRVAVGMQQRKSHNPQQMGNNLRNSANINAVGGTTV